MQAKTQIGCDFSGCSFTGTGWKKTRGASETDGRGARDSSRHAKRIGSSSKITRALNRKQTEGMATVQLENGFGKGGKNGQGIARPRNLPLGERNPQSQGPKGHDAQPTGVHPGSARFHPGF